MYTPEETAWYHQVMASGQYTQEAVIAEIMRAREANAQQVPAAQPAQQAPVAQAVAQAVQPVDNDLALFNELAELAAEDEDHTAINGGSLPAAGGCWIRFLNFIEIGLHASKNKAHKPSQVAVITVELHSAAHMYEQDGVMVPRTLDIRIPKSQGMNSRWPKFVKSVQRALEPTLGREITHMSQAIGHACLGTIYHNKDGDKTYANLDIDKAWSFAPAKYLDPASQQMVEVKIPPLHGKPSVFMMNNQKLLADPAKVKYMWDSIYVDGHYEKEKPDGTKERVSRNYHQKLIAKSIGWEQSPVKRILDAQGCTTTFGEKPAEAPAQQAALPANLAAQMQAGAAIPAEQQQVELPQQQANPIMGNPSAGAGTMPAMPTATAVPAAMSVPDVPSIGNANAAPAGMGGGMPAPAQPAMAQQTPAAAAVAAAPQAAMNAAQFMNQFAQ